MPNYDAQQHRAGQIISPLTLQTITTAQMMSVGGEVIHVLNVPNDIFRVGETRHFKCRVLIDTEVY